MGRWKSKPKREHPTTDAEPQSLDPAAKAASCRYCEGEFASKRKLFTHLRTVGSECNRKAVQTGDLAPAPPVRDSHPGPPLDWARVFAVRRLQ